jgi:hypothetical protein
MSNTGIFLDAKGPMDSPENPCFLGAHMVNDPTWMPPETPVPLASLESQANCEFNEDFTLAAKRDIKKNEELPTLCCFEESEEGEEEEEDDRKPAAKQFAFAFGDHRFAVQVLRVGDLPRALEIQSAGPSRSMASVDDTLIRK